MALQQGWVEPSYRQVYEIVKALPQALVTLAQEGGETYREEYELLYRREAGRANEIWQADHCLLPIWVKDGQGKSARPWLTVIEDDKSRAIAGYRLSWSARSRDSNGPDAAAGGLGERRPEMAGMRYPRGVLYGSWHRFHKCASFASWGGPEDAVGVFAGGKAAWPRKD